MAYLSPLYEVAWLSATVGTSETPVAHTGSKAPDFVTAIVVNAAQHNVSQTKVADGTNVYLIGDAASLTVKVRCEWFSGR